MFLSKLVAILIYCASYTQVHSHAKTTQIIISPNCTQEDLDCFPLSKLYTDSQALSSDTTIKFLSGVHSLTSNIIIRDITDVTFQFEMNSQIHCDNRSNFVFMNVTNLQVIGLKMTNCGVEIDEALIEEALFVQTETVQTIKKGL